jgi:predicted nucleic acid-binding Zn ribbon protein
MSRRPRPLADALPRLKQHLAPHTLLADVQEEWEAIAGAEIARHSVPVAERAGVVTVRCEAGVWAAELSMMSPALLARLNEKRGSGSQVRELRFVVGPGTPS